MRFCLGNGWRGFAAPGAAVCLGVCLALAAPAAGAEASLPPSKAPLAPYSLQVASFPGGPPTDEFAHGVAARIAAAPLPTLAWGVAPGTEVLPGGPDEGTRVVLTGFPDLREAYAYGLRLVLSSPSGGLAFDGFRVLRHGLPLGLRPDWTLVREALPLLRSGRVVRRRAPVFRHPEWRVPPLLAAVGQVEPGEPVLLAEDREVCEPSGRTCLRWHRVIFGEEHRAGYVRASDVLDLTTAVPASGGRSGGAVAYLRLLGWVAAPADRTGGTGREGLFDLWVGTPWREPRRAGRLRVPLPGGAGPEVRWVGGRPVVVAPDGSVLLVGPLPPVAPRRVRHRTS